MTELEGTENLPISDTVFSVAQSLDGLTRSIIDNPVPDNPNDIRNIEIRVDPLSRAIDTAATIAQETDTSDDVKLLLGLAAVARRTEIIARINNRLRGKRPRQ
jgi:hypothetical protein